MEGASVLPSSKTKHWTSLLWGDRRQLQNESETRHLTEKAHHDTNILCRRIGLVHLQNNTHSVGDPTRQELDFFDAGGGHTPLQQCWRTYRDGFCPMSAYCRFNHMNIKIAYDSTYAASCTQGIWAPNQAAQHWLCLCQTTSYVSFRYVAAHTSLQDWGSINNEAADAAVKSHKFKIGCVQAFNTHLRYHPYLTLPGGNCQDFARTSFNSAFRRTAEPSFQQTSTQQHDNRRTVFKQHQEHFHSKRGTAEEQDAYNKVKTYKDHSNNGPDDSGHRDLYVHNWTRKCGYKMQVASTNSSRNLGSIYKAKPTQGKTLSDSKKQRSLGNKLAMEITNHQCTCINSYHHGFHKVGNIAEHLRTFPTDYHPLLLLGIFRAPRELAWKLFLQDRESSTPCPVTAGTTI